MLIGGLAAAAVLVAALVITKPWASADPIVNPVQPSNAPTAANPAPQPAVNTAANAPANPAPTTVPPTTNPAAPQPNAAAPNTPVPPPTAAGVALNNVANPAQPLGGGTATLTHDADATELFSSDKTGLKYRLQQRVKDFTGNDVGRDVDLTTRFKDHDQVRFVFESNVDGYLYVIQQGSSGNWTVLFPNPEINGGRNAIKRGQELMVPSPSEGWFSLDPPAGTDQVMVILGKEPLQTLPGFSKSAYPTVPASNVATAESGIRTRDLHFSKTTGTAEKPGNVNYVVNPTEVGKSVKASIALNHGQ
jgi:hypothetical protein